MSDDRAMVTPRCAFESAPSRSISPKAKKQTCEEIRMMKKRKHQSEQKTGEIQADEKEVATFLRFMSQQNNSRGAPTGKNTRLLRSERTIGKVFLPPGTKSTFRITLTRDNLLMDNDIWAHAKDDLRIIGFLGDYFPDSQADQFIFGNSKSIEHHRPLSCMSAGGNAAIYKPILKQLPLIFATRLCILRLLSQLVFEHTPTELKTRRILKDGLVVEELPSEAILKILTCYRNMIGAVRPAQRAFEEKVPFDNPGKKAGRKRIRIDLTELGQGTFHIKTWQPTIGGKWATATNLSCQDVGSEADKIVHQMRSKLPLDGPCDWERKIYFKMGMRVQGQNNLASYPWDQDHDDHPTSIAYARKQVMTLLAERYELCGVFAMKQLWGDGIELQEQLKAMQAFLWTLAASPTKTL